MKLVKFLPLALMGCLLVSCENSGGGLSSSSTPADSLMYYIGQSSAYEYMRSAQRDTTLKEESSKQAFLEGVRAGLGALREGDENYNRGVMMGIQMANNMLAFSDMMDVTLNKTIFTSSLTSALAADTMPNMGIIQSETRKIQTSIEDAKKAKDEASSQQTLAQAAAKANLPKIDGDLYGKVTSTTTGKQLDLNDPVTAEIKLTKENGEPLQFPLSPKGQIGNQRSFPPVVSIAMTKLKSGETGEFLTTGHAISNGRAKQMGLEPNEIIKMTIKATFDENAEKEEAKPAAAQAPVMAPQATKDAKESKDSKDAKPAKDAKAKEKGKKK